MTPPPLVLRSRTGTSLSLAPLRRLEAEDASDDWAANWLAAEVTAVAGAFQGRFEAALRTEELAAFKDQLATLRAARVGEAVLACTEPSVAIRIASLPVGRLEVRCVVRDDPAGIEGGELSFALELEHADLAGLIGALDEIARAFPVIGDPGKGDGPLELG